MAVYKFWEMNRSRSPHRAAALSFKEIRELIVAREQARCWSLENVFGLCDLCWEILGWSDAFHDFSKVITGFPLFSGHIWTICTLENRTSKVPVEVSRFFHEKLDRCAMCHFGSVTGKASERLEPGWQFAFAAARSWSAPTMFFYSFWVLCCVVLLICWRLIFSKMVPCDKRLALRIWPSKTVHLLMAYSSRREVGFCWVEMRVVWRSLPAINRVGQRWYTYKILVFCWETNFCSCFLAKFNAVSCILQCVQPAIASLRAQDCFPPKLPSTCAAVLHCSCAEVQVLDKTRQWLALHLLR